MLFSHDSRSKTSILCYFCHMHASRQVCCCADALSMDKRTVPVDARQALLHQMQHQPASAAVLWLACVHLIAYNSLPDCTVHRLGHLQQPVVLKWQQVPPASCHARVRGVLATAAGTGLGCLGLTIKPQVGPANCGTYMLCPHLTPLTLLCMLNLIHTTLVFESH